MDQWIGIIVQTLSLLAVISTGFVSLIRRVDRALVEIDNLKQQSNQERGRVDALHQRLSVESGRIDMLFMIDGGSRRGEHAG